MGAEKLNFADMQPFEPVLEGEENPPSHDSDSVVKTQHRFASVVYQKPEAALGDQQPGSADWMTIFYGGQVLVFNDLQAEKAKEIMGLATTGSSKIFAGFVKKLGFENQSNVVAENNSQEIKAPQYRRPSTE
ncbi:hypothetical protein ACFXTI_014432 [Malus domestica]